MSRRRLLLSSTDQLNSGLVFHAPFNNSTQYKDVVSGISLNYETDEMLPIQDNYASLDGENRLYLDDLTLPTGNSPATLAIWINPESFGVEGAGTGYCDFYGYGQPAQSEARLIAANTDQLCAHLYAEDYDADFPWRMDVWTHCAITVDSDGVAVYADGKLLGVSALEPQTAPGQLSIGGLMYGESTAHLNGKVRDARVYNRVLSAEEITKLAQL